MGKGEPTVLLTLPTPLSLKVHSPTPFVLPTIRATCALRRQAHTDARRQRGDTSFERCSCCGVLALRRVWSNGTGWRELPRLASPLCGNEHICTSDATALEQALEDMAAWQRWGKQE